VKYQVSASSVAIRGAGAVVAAATTVAGVGLMAWANLGLLGGFLLAFAVGAALLVGWAYGPTALSARRPWRFALSLAVKAVLFGELAIVVLAVAQASFGGPGIPGLLIWAALVVPVGLIYMLPVTIPVALLTTAVLRHAAHTSPARGGALVLAVSVLAVAVGAGLAFSPPLESSDITQPVRLTWTVENHSDRDAALGIWTGDVDQLASGHEASWGGTDIPAEACFVSSGHLQESSDWFVSLDLPENDNAEVDPRPSPLIVAAQAPGNSPSVRVVIARDGSVTAIPSSAAPSDGDLVVNLCTQALP
jgi:hypothetical protein